MFNMRGCGLPLNCTNPSYSSYNPKLWQELAELNINAVTLMGGIEGDTEHLHMIDNPDTWAQNLDRVLEMFSSHGIKVVFGFLGTGWRTLLGINQPDIYNWGNPPEPPTPLPQALAMIDQLGGNNSLGKNFFADSRVAIWSCANEPDLTIPGCLDWILAVNDAMRSYGARTMVSSPRGVGGWDVGEDFHVIEPLLREHVDFLNRHLYEAWEFNSNRDPVAFKAYFKNSIQTKMLDGRGRFPVEALIEGEFGIWKGYGFDFGIGASFTDLEQANYHKAILEALDELGIKNVFFLTFGSEVNYKGERETPDFGIVDVGGAPYPLVYDVIRQAYTPTPKISLAPPIIFGASFVGLAYAIWRVIH